MAAANTIPTIDLTPLRSGSDADKREVARQIDAACRDTGFFMVTGHGVSQRSDQPRRASARSTSLRCPTKRR